MSDDDTEHKQKKVCFACGQTVPSDNEEPENDDGKLTMDELRGMSPEEHIERKAEVDTFLEEQGR